VDGEGKDGHGASEGAFDSTLIPQKKWTDWEKDRRMNLVTEMQRGDVYREAIKSVRVHGNLTPVGENHL